MLNVSGLACSRGERRLFADVGFSLAAGEWLHVQGENGSGKTSLMRLLVGLSPADAGEIFWHDEPTPSVFRKDRRLIDKTRHCSWMRPASSGSWLSGIKYRPAN